eukprot:SAG11_NODE_2112_length_3800_cov_7.869765_2_plen_129_part_00
MSATVSGFAAACSADNLRRSCMLRPGSSFGRCSRSMPQIGAIAAKRSGYAWAIAQVPMPPMERPLAHTLVSADRRWLRLLKRCSGSREVDAIGVNVVLGDDLINHRFQAVDVVGPPDWALNVQLRVED